MTVRLGVEAWGLSGDLRNTGMGQYTMSLLRCLAGYAPELSILAYGGPDEPRPLGLPTRITWRPIGRHVPMKFTALYSRSLSLPIAARADRLDLFHAPAVHMRPLFPPVPRLDCPLVVTLHDLIVQTYYELKSLPVRQQLFYRWNVRRAVRAERLITVSESARRDIIRETGIASERVTVLHNAVEFRPNQDRKPIDRLGIQSPYILYAGSFEPRKNLSGAVRAFGNLVKEGFAHHLVALVERESGHMSAAIKVIGDLGLQDRVHLVHSLPESDLRSLYTHATTLFFPSFAEGFGYPPVQAAACGVPVVASDLAVLREVMGDAALFVDPSNDSAMTQGLRSVILDSACRARLQAEGVKRAGRYEPRRWTAGHVDIYRQLSDEDVAPALNPVHQKIGGRSL